MELINNIVKGLAKVFQFFLQFLAGEEDTALHGAQREVQLFSDFVIAHIFETAHLKNPSATFRKVLLASNFDVYPKESRHKAVPS